MWGSASVVGHIMCHIIGYNNVRAFSHAQSLGEAMQLANFLRDIDEDYQDRNRIYLPMNDLAVFGVTENMIAQRQHTKELKNALRYFYEKNEKLFDRGIYGLRFLHWKNIYPLLLASYTYRENIRILKKRNFNPFLDRIRIPTWKKVWFSFLITFAAPVYLLSSYFSKNQKYQENEESKQE
tara:strand:- start:9 stop:551 length:543 start_codon:yes stop_codon:yes gene_type:complete